MTVTLETPCLTDGNWVRRSADSRGVDGHDLCDQCFPDGWDTVAEKDVETFLTTGRTRSKLHRSIDTGDDADTSGFGDHDYPDQTLASRVLNDEVTVEHEFEWDRAGGDA
ncbi:hypothetical protein EGH21_12525 [Halomicroarcula sp. F13]|uniref:Transcriptional regulator n=1 Tax=Haloarcula rubra TaxID=2487747 RepID=A0AAW4PTG9_9EURY|nr:hypothetical protein [Halomicroarcula rubra]MBX0323855.1 hypothetical protein [Halomicroarcula rubra]